MTCPICSRACDEKMTPFCSKRCADVDLAKWLGGGYAIASDDPDDLDEVLDEMARREAVPPTH